MANRNPAFFKFMATPSCLERIQIPAAYTKYKRGNLPRIVILKDPYENHWPMEVEKFGSEFFLAKDWETFVQENHVEVGDIIVFKYGSHNVFSIILYGQDSCLKKGIGGLKIEEVVESDQEIDEVDERKQEVDKEKEIDEVEERKQEVDKEKEVLKGTPNDSTGGLKAEGFKKLQTKKLVSHKRARFSNKKSQTVPNEVKGKLSASQSDKRASFSNKKSQTIPNEVKGKLGASQRDKRARFSNKKSQTVPNEVKGKLGASQSERDDDGSIKLVSHGNGPFYSTAPERGPSPSINSTALITCQDFREVLERQVEQLNEQHAQQIRETQEQNEKFLEDVRGMLPNIQGVKDLFQSQVQELTRQQQARVEEQKRMNQDQFREFCSRHGVSLSDTFSPIPFVDIDSDTDSED